MRVRSGLCGVQESGRSILKRLDRRGTCLCAGLGREHVRQLRQDVERGYKRVCRAGSQRDQARHVLLSGLRAHAPVSLLDGVEDDEGSAASVW